MATVKTSLAASGVLCGQTAGTCSMPGPPTVMAPQELDKLIINRSFNGLLDRIARIDFFGVWLNGTKVLKKAKRERIEAVMQISEVCALTGLTKEDIALLCSLRLIEVVEAGEDPLLSFRDVFSLVKVFDRFVDDGVIRQTTEI